VVDFVVNFMVGFVVGFVVGLVTCPVRVSMDGNFVYMRCYIAWFTKPSHLYEFIISQEFQRLPVLFDILSITSEKSYI
jgi:hypothetical protein